MTEARAGSTVCSGVEVAQCAAVTVAGLSVRSVPITPRFTCYSTQVPEELGGAIFTELNKGDPEGALFSGVDVREAGHYEMPAQQLEEHPLPHLVGCLPDTAVQLVHAAHHKRRIQH